MIWFFILLGDKIDYGGVVIIVLGNISIGGKGIVCVGDKVICLWNGYGGMIVIVMGDLNVIIDGK